MDIVLYCIEQLGYKKMYKQIPLENRFQGGKHGKTDDFMFYIVIFQNWNKMADSPTGAPSPDTDASGKKSSK